MLLLLLTALFLAALSCEKFLHERRLRTVPLRICVTGTRGKSSVTRMLAAVLRQGGRRVLAKTTGSQACFVLPDGTEEEIPRHGLASILEQKHVVHRAASLGADCLVVELMSIRPENHRAESLHLLKPAAVAVTNVRLDHVEAMGASAEEIASTFALAVPPCSTVFVPAAAGGLFEGRSRLPRSARLKIVAEDECASILLLAPSLNKNEFVGDLNLVTAIARHFGIADPAVASGIRQAGHDLGRLRIWVIRLAGRTYYLANAFAANDPDSTRRALDKVREQVPQARAVAGLLSLRADRPDRTAQWIGDLKRGAASWFDMLFVTGPCSNVVRRRLRHARRIASSSPGEITAAVTAGLADQTIVFGFGNIGGTGRGLVEHWERIGEPHAL